MTKEGPERILDGLRKFSRDDDVLYKFLKCIFNKELDEIHFWNKEYNSKVEKYSKIWDGNDED